MRGRAQGLRSSGRRTGRLSAFRLPSLRPRGQALPGDPPSQCPSTYRDGRGAGRAEDVTIKHQKAPVTKICSSFSGSPGKAPPHLAQVGSRPTTCSRTGEAALGAALTLETSSLGPPAAPALPILSSPCPGVVAKALVLHARSCWMGAEGRARARGWMFWTHQPRSVSSGEHVSRLLSYLAVSPAVTPTSHRPGGLQISPGKCFRD